MVTPVHNCTILKDRLSFCILQKKTKEANWRTPLDTYGRHI
jgi:hypothetical protein